MGIPRATLSVKQQRMLDKKSAAELGLKRPQERAQMASRGAEASEHVQLCGWLTRHGLEAIHAPTRRKVKDLEPGWEDFTIFHRDKYILIEIKVEGGIISADQRRVHARHRAAGMPSFVAGSYSEAVTMIRAWLGINFGWTPE